MTTKEIMQNRFEELSEQNVGEFKSGNYIFADRVQWGNWSSAALNLVQIVFGTSSAHYARLKLLIEKEGVTHYQTYREAKGVFQAAKTDYEKGCYKALDKLVSGEVFGDFIAVAKRALSEDKKDVAAVLACAALEDALKRLAAANGLVVDGKDMSEVISALKAKSLVGGAQKSILDTMPKTRNNAMHADWAKISPTEVGGVIGFTEQFLIQHFS